MVINKISDPKVRAPRNQTITLTNEERIVLRDGLLSTASAENAVDSAPAHKGGRGGAIDGGRKGFRGRDVRPERQGGSRHWLEPRRTRRGLFIATSNRATS